MTKITSALLLLVLNFSIAHASIDQKIMETHPFPLSPDAHAILWVVDNSGSMDDYQQAILKLVPEFFQTIAGHGQWQMGIVTTDGLLYGFDESGGIVNSSKANATQLFSDLFSQIGTNGSGEEMPFASINHALSSRKAFFQPGQKLDIILVTDAEDQSTSVHSPEIIALKLQTAMSIPSGDIRMYSLVASKDMGCDSAEGEWNFVGSAYERFTATTSGKAYKLCDSLMLKEVGVDVAKSLDEKHGSYPAELKLRLAGIPDIFSDMDVMYDNQSLPMGFPSRHSRGDSFWYYDNTLNSVVVYSLDKFAKPTVNEIKVFYSM